MKKALIVAAIVSALFAAASVLLWLASRPTMVE